MPRVRCPECDKVLAVPDDYQRPTVVCPSCGHNFYLDEAGGEGDRPRRNRDRRPARAEEPDRAPRKKKKPIKGYVPLLIFGPVGGLIALLAPFSIPAALVAILLGLPLMLVGIFRVYAIFKEMGKHHELDAAAYGIGRWRGIAVIVVSIVWAFRRPRKLGAWVFLELLGMAIMIEGILIGVWGAERERLDRVAQLEEQIFAERERQQNQGFGQELTEDQVIDKALADLGTGNPGAVANAANRLANMQPARRRDEVAAKLAGLAAMPDLFARRAVVRALGVWATPNEVPALVTALQGDDRDTKKEALEHIGRFRDERAVEPVARCLEDLLIAETAQKALREMGPMAEEAVMPLLNSTNIPAKRAAIEALRDIGTIKCRPALTAIIKSKNAFFAPIALEARKAINGRLKAALKQKQDERKKD